MSSTVLYIAGWGRSGSTLLDRLLGQMTGVVSVGEMRDIWQRGVVENRLCGCGAPFADCAFWSKVGDVAFGSWSAVDIERVSRLRRALDRPWSVPFLLAPALLPARYRRDLDEYAALLARLYAAIEEVSNAEVIVDSSKIPSYALLLRAAGVSPRILHLVRDSRGVIHSWRKQVLRADAGDRPDYMGRYGVVSGSVRYALYNGMAHLLQGAGLPYRRVRYEDVAAAPVPMLRQITAYAGVREDTEVLASLEDGTCRLVSNHTVDGNPMRFTVGAVAIRVDDAWRRDLPTWPRLVVTALTAPLLAGYRYLRPPAGISMPDRSAA